VTKTIAAFEAQRSAADNVINRIMSAVLDKAFRGCDCCEQVAKGNVLKWKIEL
jgi:hypothetical protein